MARTLQDNVKAMMSAGVPEDEIAAFVDKYNDGKITPAPATAVTIATEPSQPMSADEKARAFYAANPLRPASDTATRRERPPMLAVDLMNRFGEASAGKVAEGASDIGQGNYSRGARKVLQGAGTFAGVAGAPLLIPEIAAAGVVPTMAGLVGSAAAASVAQPTVEYLGKRFGLSEDQAGLLGDLVGAGVGIKAYKPSQKAPAVLKKVVPKAIGTVARLPIFDKLPVTLAATGLGMVSGAPGGPVGIAAGGLGGRFAGAGANRVIAAARKLGLPPKAAQPLIRSAAQGLKDVGPLVEELSGFKVFTQDALKQGEKVVTAVTEAKAAGLPVPPQAQAQADRVIAANNVFNVETNTIPEMGRIVADVIDDEAIGGNISRLTAKRAKALLAKVTEGIDAMDRAGKPVPEALRQVFEGLQDRLGSESADAMSTIIGAARQGKDALRDAISVLTSTQEGKAIYGSIQRNSVTRLALESARRLAANVGGSLTRPSKPKSNQLLDILESMGRRVEEVQVAPERPVGGGFTTPSGVDVVRTGRGAAVSVDAMPEPVLEATAGSSTTSPQAQTPSTQAPAQPRKRSTVQERAVARGTEPVVQSGILTPDEIRAALSNRPGLQVVLDAQELARNRVRPVGDIVLSRFREGYKALVGKYPKDQSKHYGVSHVAGKFYSGGQNAVNPKETALRKQLLSQFGIEE